MDGEVTLASPEGDRGKWAFRIRENGGVTARAITMQTLMMETGISHIDLLKMDVEGAEVEIFENCPWIDDVSRIVIELHDRMRPGCTQVLGHATKSWEREQKGELTFFRRHRKDRFT